MKISSSFIFLFMVLALCHTLISQDALTVHYFHRPPLYETLSDGSAGGFLIEITRLVLEDAGIEYIFEETPPKRILEILSENTFSCSAGWFFTPERQEKYIFSESLYQDRENVFIINTISCCSESPVDIKTMLSSECELTLVDSFSYGQWYDDALLPYLQKINRVNVMPLNIIRMVNARRTGYTMTSKEEALWVLANFPECSENTAVITIKDAPRGNLRYILFPVEFDPELLRRIDSSIERIKKSDSYRRILKPYE